MAEQTIRPVPPKGPEPRNPRDEERTAKDERRGNDPSK